MMNKRIILSILALLFVAPLVPPVTVNAEEKPIRVAFGSPDLDKNYFDNSGFTPDRDSLIYVDFPDVQPLIIDDRVFVPIRPIVETDWFWGDVTWDETTSTATVVSLWGLDWHDDAPYDILTELVMRPGYASVTRRNTYNGQIEFTATPEILPQIIDGRFMVPLRTLEYAMYAGNVLVWDDETRTACILGVAS